MSDHSIAEVMDAIAKPEEDNRQYKGFVLSNGLKVVLISDPFTDISAAALDINVGSMSDPIDIPGLTHFLEHMLFMGTKKYPEENDYMLYISRNGGSSNAYTAGTHTNFHFSVSTDHLSGALDRFAQFFIDPLMNESATEREMKAVNSEFEIYHDQDAWRLYRLQQALTDPNHDFSKFTTGNIESLRDIPLKSGIDVRKALLEYYGKWFSANIMSLVVLGKEPIEELTKMTIPLFSPIENKNVRPSEWTENPLTSDYLSKQVITVPIRDFRQLEVTFPIPDTTQYYKSKPDDYIAHLIGHEGPGSLLSELKSRKLCTALMAGGYTEAKGFGFFRVNIDLTVDGIDRTDDIITLLFQYINLLKKEGPKQWIFDENKSIKDINFRFSEREKPFNYTRKLAKRLKDYPINEILSGPELIDQYRPDLITQILDCLRPNNMRVFVIGKKFEGMTDSTEKWFGVNYKMSSIDHDQLVKWDNCGLNERFSLPPVNKFIPRDLSLRAQDTNTSDVPDIIKNNELSRVWHLQDTKYQRPLAVFTFKLTIPIAYSSPLDQAFSSLVTRLLEDGLNEYCYGPSLAGLHSQIWSFNSGFTIRFSGYNDKLAEFMSEILKRVKNFQIDPKRFDVIKEVYARNLKNFPTYDLSQQLGQYSSWILSERFWTHEEILDTESEWTVDSVQQFMARLWSRFHIEALIHGNVNRSEAMKVFEVFESHFTTTKTIPLSQHFRNREIKLTEGSNLYFETTATVHQTNAIRVYLPIGVEDMIRENQLLQLFVQLISETFFDDLRTKQQLGYAVRAWYKRSLGVQGLLFIIQSDYSPEYLNDRIEAFISWTKDFLTSMSAEVFESEKQSLITRILESPKKMFEYSNRLWEEINSRVYHFGRQESDVQVIRGLTKEDVIKFYEQYVSHESPNRKKISIRIRSANKQSKVLDKDQVSQLYPTPKLENCEPIEDVHRLKERSALYPLPKPYIEVNQLDGTKH